MNISSYKESELWRTSNSIAKSWSFHSTYVEGKNTFTLLLKYGDFHTYLAMNICIGIGLQFTKSRNLKNIVAKSWSFHSTYVESKNTIHFNFDVWRFPIHIRRCWYGILVLVCIQTQHWNIYWWCGIEPKLLLFCDHYLLMPSDRASKPDLKHLTLVLVCVIQSQHWTPLVEQVNMKQLLQACRAKESKYHKACVFGVLYEVREVLLRAEILSKSQEQLY